MNLLSFFRPGSDGRAIPADIMPRWTYKPITPVDLIASTSDRFNSIDVSYIDPIASAASTMGKRGAAVRHDRERAKVRAKCNEMCVAMGRGPAFKDVT